MRNGCLLNVSRGEIGMLVCKDHKQCAVWLGKALRTSRRFVDSSSLKRSPPRLQRCSEHSGNQSALSKCGDLSKVENLFFVRKIELVFCLFESQMMMVFDIKGCVGKLLT